MKYTADQYRRMILKLLPVGKAWTRAPGSLLDAFAYALANELDRVDARLRQLLEESDPRSAIETLDQWESFLGLPDECVGPGATISERRAAILERLTTRGGISRADYINMAKALGYDVTITEFRPFRAGSKAGDALTNGDWIYYWRINANEFNARFFTAGGGRAGDPLVHYSNDILECVIEKKNRAGRNVIFGYS